LVGRAEFVGGSNWQQK